MKLTLTRQRFIPAFGLDSLQGILECASWYKGSEAEPGCVVFCSRKGDEQHPNSLISTIARLQKEGYLEAIWVPSEDSSSLQLEHLTLTVAGHKLLAELREKSASGRLKRRLSDLIWVIVLSVLTTLVTLQVKGE